MDPRFMRYLAWLLLFLTAETALGSSPVYSENFDGGLSGWTSLGEAYYVPQQGAVDGRGYMKARRDNRFPPQH